MSAAAVEHPHDDDSYTLLRAANRIMEQLPGHRVEILEGNIIVAPPADGPHASALTTLMIPFLAAGLHGEESEVLQSLGLWLPTGPADYAVPDLAVVDADYANHETENNCYEPVCFRLVLEVTSSNHSNDLKTKVRAYAQAGIPVYVIVDRKNVRVHLLTDPVGEGYDSHTLYAPGRQLTLPDSIGAKVTLDAGALLEAGGCRIAGPDATG
ncbi:Uma2 family endonuclease [Streptomyces sp. NPDC006326]|uniref:Uma2 family endonuclease n=1 Tax=Streptomyces sp. NPDC006326 TaxID=3156752 RepID=UPI0033A2E4EE